MDGLNRVIAHGNIHQTWKLQTGAGPAPGLPPQHKMFDTRSEAEALGRSTESEIDRGTFVARAEAERTALAAALERYKAEVSCLKAHPAQATSASRIGCGRRSLIAI